MEPHKMNEMILYTNDSGLVKNNIYIYICVSRIQKTSCSAIILVSGMETERSH